jgi:hypothetical protein
MNKTPHIEAAPRARNPFVPLLILAVAMLSIQGQELVNLEQVNRTLAGQLEQVDREAQANHNENAKLDSLFRSLVALANTDMDARAIVIKHGLQITPPATESAPGANTNR